MQKFIFMIGSLYGFVMVALGAFGAHALKDKLSEYALSVYETGVRYGMTHAVVILICAWALSVFHPGWVSKAALCFAAGILIFSGSLFVLAFTAIRAWGAVTPVGGLLLLLGWVLLAVSALKGSS